MVEKLKINNNNNNNNNKLMNENIDLTKILKNCPTGWEFYSSIYGNVTFHRIENNLNCPISFFFIGKDGINRQGSVTKQGTDAPYCNGECTFFPAKHQRVWSKFTAPWYKKDKFDPKTLKPFDKVLARDDSNCYWNIEFFSHYIKNDMYPYKCIVCNYKLCIPYNDDTKYLIGTTEEAPEYYRYWEN